MKFASRLVWLYPDAWRKRYGDEFVALVEDIGPSPGLVLDVAVAAIRLRFAGLFYAVRRPRLANGLNPGGEQMIAQSRHQIPRLLLYAVAGGLVGFLFLGEFALRTFVPLLILLALLAVGSLIAAVRGNSRLSPWAAFLVAAMIVPLMIDSRIVGLPKCGDVAAGVACFAGSRDYQTLFLLEVVVVTIAAASLAVQARRIASTQQRT
jgi:hypothetical protein